MHKFQTDTPGVYDIGAFEPFIHAISDENEQYHSMVLILNLTSLNGYVNDYAGAIGLHTHTEGLRRDVLAVGQADMLTFNRNMHMLKLWDEMAGREAAMTVFHLGKSLAAIRATMKDAPTVRADTDHNALREAAKLLEREFPNYELARHAAGHRAEAMASFDTLKKHAVDLGDRQQFIPGVVQDHTYVATFEKRELRVNLTENSRLKLAQVVSLIYSAFPKFSGLLPPINIGSAIPAPGPA